MILPSMILPPARSLLFPEGLERVWNFQTLLSHAFAVAYALKRIEGLENCSYSSDMKMRSNASSPPPSAELQRTGRLSPRREEREKIRRLPYPIACDAHRSGFQSAIRTLAVDLHQIVLDALFCSNFCDERPASESPTT